MTKVYILTKNVDVLEVALDYIKHLDEKELIVLKDLDPELLDESNDIVLIAEQEKVNLPLKYYLKKNIKLILVSEISLGAGKEYYVSFEMGYKSKSFVHPV